MPFTPLTQEEGEMMEHYVCQCVSARVCERDRERQERTVGRGIKHSSLIRHNLSGATSQYHTISHILRITNLAAAGLLRRSVELFLPPLARSLAQTRCRAEIQFCGGTDGRGCSFCKRSIACKNVWYVLAQIKPTYYEAFLFLSLFF